MARSGWRIAHGAIPGVDHHGFDLRSVLTSPKEVTTAGCALYLADVVRVDRARLTIAQYLTGARCYPQRWKTALPTEESRPDLPDARQSRVLSQLLL